MELVPQGPKASARQSSENGASTMEPSFTRALVLPALALTVKSVPRTPIAAIGVFRRKRWRAALAALPEIARVMPSIRSNLTVESAGRAGS